MEQNRRTTAALALLLVALYGCGDVGWDYDSNKWLPDRLDDAINARSLPPEDGK